MGRLIDADALIEELKTLQVSVTGLRAGKGILAEYAKQYRESILRVIDEQPTAYDVEKVVQELNEESSMFHSMFGYSVCSIRLGKAKDIVRKGGVE